MGMEERRIPFVELGILLQLTILHNIHLILDASKEQPIYVLILSITSVIVVIISSIASCIQI